MASELIPVIAWATQRVTTSASLRIRFAFFAACGRRSSAVQNTAISNRSRSARSGRLDPLACPRRKVVAAEQWSSRVAFLVLGRGTSHRGPALGSARPSGRGRFKPLWLPPDHDPPRRVQRAAVLVERDRLRRVSPVTVEASEADANSSS